MDDRIRASDADRDHVTARLRHHGWCAAAAHDSLP